MSWFSRIFNRSRSRPATPNAPLWLQLRTHSGINLNENTARTYSAVWGCVRYISDSIAQLPWQVRRKNAVGSELLENHLVNVLLYKRPHVECSAFSLKQHLVQSALLYGNGYAEIARDTLQRPAMLCPIHPGRVTVEREAEEDGGGIVYRVQSERGSSVLIPARDMFHLIGSHSSDGGLTGLSTIAFAAHSIGLGLAMERFGSTFFGNNASPGGVLQHPGVLSDAAREQLRDSMKSRYSGENAHSTMVLEEGMTFTPLSIPPEEAQFLESRQFSVVDVCRWFGVPPHKVGDLSRATYSNIEHQAIEVVTDTLLPWIKRLEEEANYKLLTGIRDRNCYTNINVSALLRGDSMTRAKMYQSLFSMGALSPNDVRRLEDMNEIPDGNRYFVPLNLTTLENVDKVVEIGTNENEEQDGEDDEESAEEDEEDDEEDDSGMEK